MIYSALEQPVEDGSGGGYVADEMPHVVDDEQVGLEVFAEEVSVGDGFFVHEFNPSLDRRPAAARGNRLAVLLSLADRKNLRHL